MIPLFIEKSNYKTRRKSHHKQIVSFNKLIKQKVRIYQRENSGKDPRVTIPANTYYCYNTNQTCPHWYSIEIPENERDSTPGIVAINQNFIGGCKFLKQTDDDFNSSGLLWDQCKECGLKMEQIK